MKRTRSAFTLVEVLIALTLLAIIMLSIGAAVNAAVDSYQSNDALAAATNSARAVLQRVLTDVRQAAAIDQHLTDSTGVGIYLPRASASDDQIELYYHLDDAGVFRMDRYVNGTLQASYPLLGDGDGLSVSTLSVTTSTGTDWKGLNCVKCVDMRLGVDCSGHETFVSGSAYPRRNLIF